MSKPKIKYKFRSEHIQAMESVMNQYGDTVSAKPGKDTVTINTELADVDGSYGENDNGIFFFTPDGKYVEWTGEYLYSDIPFEVDSPVVKYRGG